MSDAIRRMGYTLNRMSLTESDKRFRYQGKKVKITHTLLLEPLQISEGKAKVPEKPGIGIKIDMDAIDKYRVV